MAVAIGIAGLVIAAAGTAGSIYMQKKAADKQDDIAEQEQNRQELESRRKRQRIRSEALQRRAAAIASAEGAGAADAGGSTVNSINSVTSRASENVGFLNTVDGIVANQNKLGRDITRLGKIGGIFEMAQVAGNSMVSFSGMQMGGGGFMAATDKKEVADDTSR